MNEGLKKKNWINFSWAQSTTFSHNVHNAELHTSIKNALQIYSSVYLKIAKVKQYEKSGLN